MNMKETRLGIGISLTLVLAFALLSSCAPAATPTPVTVVTKAPPKEIVIGNTLGLSGPAAPTGLVTKNADELAVEIINNAYPDLDPLPLAKTEGLPNLGGAKVRVVWTDMKADPATAMAEAERMITEVKVDAMMCGMFSSCCATISEACERYGMPVLCSSQTSPKLHQRGFKWFFRSSPHDGTMAENQLQFLADLRDKKGFPIKTLALLHEDTLWGTDSADVQAELAPKYGFEVVENIAYPRDTADMSSEILRVKASNADVVLPTSYSADAIVMQKTIKELDYNPKGILAQDSGHTHPSYLEALGRDAEYGFSREVFAVDLGDKLPLLKKVNEMYRYRYGTDLYGDNAREVMGVLVLADAINRAGSTDPEAIREALSQTDLGPEQLILPWAGIEFDPDTGQNMKANAIMVEFLDGAFRTVWPFDVATTEVVWPMPKWSDRQ